MICDINTTTAFSLCKQRFGWYAPRCWREPLSIVRAFFALVLCAGGLSAHPALRDENRPDVTVTSSEQLLAALQNPAYKNIALAKANYGEVKFTGLQAGMRVFAADIASLPVFSALEISNVEDFVLADVAIELQRSPSGKYESLVYVEGAHNLRLLGLALKGAAAPTELEFRGLTLHNSRHITVSDCSFTGFHRALLGYVLQDVIIEHNDVSQMSSDGFNFAQVRNINIARNKFGAFQTSKDSHADYIQFWSQGTEEESSNITVAENLMIQGQGLDAQGIFLEFERRLPARDVTVRDNVVVQSSPHGISLYNVIGATVERNLVIAIPTSKYKVAIRMIGTSNGTFTDNISSGYGFESLQNIARARNVEINFQDKKALANTVQDIQNALDGKNSRLIAGRFKIADAVRHAGVRPLDLRHQ